MGFVLWPVGGWFLLFRVLPAVKLTVCWGVSVCALCLEVQVKPLR